MGRQVSAKEGLGDPGAELPQPVWGNRHDCRGRSVYVFVEVKTRSADSIAGPLEAVTPGKRKRLIRTALDYLQAHELNLQPRFDVAAVVVGQGEPSVEYLEDAFDGGGYELF